MIEKKQTNIENFRIPFLYYDRARDAMSDIVNQYFQSGYRDIYLPGYIGWSPKEGSGIFDPLNAIDGLARHYYRMSKNLYVNLEDLGGMLIPHSIVLLVNYFGFRDVRINEIIGMAHERECVVIEDNAHGFFTYFCKGKTEADATFFSLHKMFPFETGGGLIVNNGFFDNSLVGKRESQEFNPFLYDLNGIAKKRLENYIILLKLMDNQDEYFVPLREKSELIENIPQSFPIVIRKGNRDKIYEIMNDLRFGVVSLYHTLIDELQNEKYMDTLWLSRRILNLPIHQDCDPILYKEMIEALVDACKVTEK